MQLRLRHRSQGISRTGTVGPTLRHLPPPRPTAGPVAAAHPHYPETWPATVQDAAGTTAPTASVPAPRAGPDWAPPSTTVRKAIYQPQIRPVMEQVANTQLIKARSCHAPAWRAHRSRPELPVCRRPALRAGMSPIGTPAGGKLRLLPQPLGDRHRASRSARSRGTPAGGVQFGPCRVASSSPATGRPLDRDRREGGVTGFCLLRDVSGRGSVPTLLEPRTRMGTQTGLHYGPEYWGGSAASLTASTRWAVQWLQDARRPGASIR